MQKYMTLRTIIRNELKIPPKYCIELEDNSETKRLLSLKAIEKISDKEAKKLDFIDLYEKKQKNYTLEELTAMEEKEIDKIASDEGIILERKTKDAKAKELFEKLGE